MILVVGGLADVVTELVCARLGSIGQTYRLVDLTRYPSGHRMRWTWRDGRPDGWLETDNWRLDLADVDAVFIRHLGAEGRLPGPAATAAYDRAIQIEADMAITAMVETLPCLVVNRLGGGLTNHSKPLQALHIQAAGLRIPATIVTTDPAAARAFIDAHGGDVIYKSISGVRSIVHRLETTRFARLELLRHGPAQLQERIEGDDIRAHVVGDRIIATRIRSEAADYRYASRDGLEADMEPTTLPPPVEAACLRLAWSLDLPVAGIDLRETPDGQHVCFEINPAPAFSHFERQSGQPISLAVAELLAGAGSRPSPEAAYATS